MKHSPPFPLNMLLKSFLLLNVLLLKIILTFFNSTSFLHYTAKNKTQIRAETVVLVYPQPNEGQSFWLFKIRSVADVSS